MCSSHVPVCAPACALVYEGACEVVLRDLTVSLTEMIDPTTNNSDGRPVRTHIEELAGGLEASGCGVYQRPQILVPECIHAKNKTEPNLFM